ncbi:MAG: heavy metal translocating P-type ATPase [Candidatus Xenobia bacterium]
MTPRHRTLLAIASLVGIVLHLLLQYGVQVAPGVPDVPLWLVLVGGGVPMMLELLGRIRKGELGADVLAGIATISSVLLGQYLAGSIVVLMWAGGQALEAYAVRTASAVLQALANRMPQIAHRCRDDRVEDAPLSEIAVRDVLQIFPHEICPVDGVVIAGDGAMDESYLTGEPFVMSKVPGSEVLSGAINLDRALTVRATRQPKDSRYARIMQVMEASEQSRPRLRRLGDRLGALYAPLALVVAIVAGLLEHNPMRFLAVLVVATPCPLLIGIPVAIIGTISLSARRGIIVKDPAILEQMDGIRTMIFDKTGTLTYGEPRLTEQLCAPGFEASHVLALAASLERYSKHPLADAIRRAGEEAGVKLMPVGEVSEKAGEGLRGKVTGREVRITRTSHPRPGGLQCDVLLDDVYAATYVFRDRPRSDTGSFVSHLGPRHQAGRVLIVSGDREAEVRYLAEQVGITEIHAGCTPEEKVQIVKEETKKAPTLFLGDGINDAPALMSATVGLAFGQISDITSEAAGAVILERSLVKVDEFFHISHHMRRIALQTALGGMLLSVLGMGAAAAGYLTPVAGAITQEVIDLMALLNALRAAFPPGTLTDFSPPPD